MNVSYQSDSGAALGAGAHTKDEVLWAQMTVEDALILSSESWLIVDCLTLTSSGVCKRGFCAERARYSVKPGEERESSQWSHGKCIVRDR